MMRLVVVSNCTDQGLETVARLRSLGVPVMHEAELARGDVAPAPLSEARWVGGDQKAASVEVAELAAELLERGPRAGDPLPGGAPGGLRGKAALLAWRRAEDLLLSDQATQLLCPARDPDPAGLDFRAETALAKRDALERLGAAADTMLSLLPPESDGEKKSAPRRPRDAVACCVDYRRHRFTLAVLELPAVAAPETRALALGRLRGDLRGLRECARRALREHDQATARFARAAWAGFAREARERPDDRTVDLLPRHDRHRARRSLAAHLADVDVMRAHPAGAAPELRERLDRYAEATEGDRALLDKAQATDLAAALGLTTAQHHALWQRDGLSRAAALGAVRRAGTPLSAAILRLMQEDD